MRGGKPRYDDDPDKDDRGRFTSGAPVALSSSSRPKAVTGSVTPRQTMHAITTGGGNVKGRQPGFGSQQPTAEKSTRQTGPKLSGKARRAERNGGKKGGKR